MRITAVRGGGAVTVARPEQERYDAREVWKTIIRREKGDENERERGGKGFIRAREIREE